MLRTESMKLMIVVGIAAALIGGRFSGVSAQQTPSEAAKPSLDYEYFKVRLNQYFLSIVRIPLAATLVIKCPATTAARSVFRSCRQVRPSGPKSSLK